MTETAQTRWVKFIYVGKQINSLHNYFKTPISKSLSRPKTL
jgi:hypothetical protein